MVTKRLSLPEADLKVKKNEDTNQSPSKRAKVDNPTTKPSNRQKSSQNSISVMEEILPNNPTSKSIQLQIPISISTKKILPKKNAVVTIKTASIFPREPISKPSFEVRRKEILASKKELRESKISKIEEAVKIKEEKYFTRIAKLKKNKHFTTVMRTWASLIVSVKILTALDDYRMRSIGLLRLQNEHCYL